MKSYPYRFAYPLLTTLPEYGEHRGMECCILRRLEDEEGQTEMQPLFQIECADGWKGYAYKDELERIDRTNDGGLSHEKE